MQIRRYAGVIARSEGQVALVLERRRSWGSAFWNIPSGLVEPYETPEVGAARELAEETGLLSSPERMKLVSTSVTTVDCRRSLAWNFVVDVDDPTLDVRDPDGHVLQAGWFGLEEAITLLKRLPYRPISEPVVAHLEGLAKPGAHWAYATAKSEPVVTVRP